MNQNSLLLLFLKALPASLLWLVLSIRHLLYDWRILRQYSFEIPTICVGNLAVGGTGKTPHVLMLLKIFAEHNIAAAVLSRGYGRRSNEFRYVELTDDVDMVGDEPLIIKQRFAKAVVAVCANRVVAMKRLMREHPELRVVVMDDAFQHRSVKAGLNLVLTTFDSLATRDYLLPLGRLRDIPNRMRRADIVMVSKCPPALTPANMKRIDDRLKLRPHQLRLFSSFRYAELKPVHSETVNATPPALGSYIIAVAGVANPLPFFMQLQNSFRVVKKLAFSDHHRFSPRDILQLETLHKAHTQCAFVTTEKDAVRLVGEGRLPLSNSLRAQLRILPIDVQMSPDDTSCFTKKIIHYVTEDERRNRLP